MNVRHFLTSSRVRVAAPVLWFLSFLLSNAPGVVAQESILFSAQFSTLNVLDLETLTPQQSISAAGYMAFAEVGNNPRLTFVGSSNGSYISVIDFTLGHEVSRSYGECPFATPAFTPDKKYLLFQDQCDQTLHVYDPSAQRTIRRVSLAPSVRGNALGASPGSIVVVGQKAYVTTVAPDSQRPAIAVVDLHTFRVRSIPIPNGIFDNPGLWSPNAGATPDGKYVLMAQSAPDGSSFHLLFISTAKDTLVMDKILPFDPLGLLVNPVNSPGNVYGYLLGTDTNNQFSATLIDLNTGSPTFGQLLTQTEVVLESYFSYDNGATINPEGTRLVVAGHRGDSQALPNLVVIDTTQMLHNPGGAMRGSAIVANGASPHALSIATINRTVPPTAPTVTSITSPITNDQDNVINITGTNFALGAQVRLGNMPALAASVDSATALHVTVAKDFPARANQDVVVTNPNLNAPAAQQFQSGLLSGQLTVLPTASFQPQYGFGAFDVGDYSLALYSFAQQSMIHAPNSVRPLGFAYNTDGKAIYSAGNGTRGLNTPVEVAAWNPNDGSLEAEVPFASNSSLFYLSPIQIAATVNPVTGTPAVFVPIRTTNNGVWDITLEEVDTTANSPTFNQVINTIPVGLNLPRNTGLTVTGGAATPDGKYVFVNYFYNDPQSGKQLGFIAVFDVKLGTVTSIPASTLGVAPQQTQMTVTPDGQSLLLSTVSPTSVVSGIGVFDISVNPASPTLLATLYGALPPGQGGGGTLYLYTWKVVGNRLFAVESNFGAVLAFSLDRKNQDFSQTGYYFDNRIQKFTPYIDVSPDGELLFLPIGGYDMLAVLDANKLFAGQAPFITNIGTFRTPLQPMVSPVSHLIGQLTITTSSLPAATQGVAYLATLAATGGALPYTWSVVSGSLPTGLTLNPTGEISGMPSAPGNFNFTVQLTDSVSSQVTAGLGISVHQGSTLRILTQSLPPGPANQSYYVTLSASGGVQPYTWSVQGSLPAGLSLSPAGVISGTPTTQGNSNFTVKVTDSAVPPNATTQQLGITINGTGNPGLLNGHYALMLNGFDHKPDEYTLVGSFVADGAGNITGGIADYNAPTKGPSNITFTGTYTISSSGLNLMALNSNQGPLTLAFVLNGTGDGRIVPYQQGEGWGAGILQPQDPSAFNLNKVAGTYVFGGIGADKGGDRFAEAGELTADGKGNFTNGICDMNSGGKGESCSFSGTATAVDPNTGRFVAQVTDNNHHVSHLAFYVVSSSEVLGTITDNIQTNDTAVFAFASYLQSGSGQYNNGSLSGNAVLYSTGVHTPQDGGTAVADAGLLTFDGILRLKYILDENSGGTMGYKSGYFNYSIASNGRGTFTGGNDTGIVYLVGPDKGFMVGGPTDTKATLGFLAPQTLGVYSNASLTGIYVGGTLPPSSYNSDPGIGVATFDGIGNVSNNSYNYDGNTLDSRFGDMGTVTMGANGRGFSQYGDAIYMISPDKIRVCDSGKNPTIETYSH